MTKSLCQVCGKTFGGIPLVTVQDGKHVEACPSCYKTLNGIYLKTSCLACVFFNVSACELFGTELEEPYVNSSSCSFFTTDPNPETAAKARIKKFEMAGRYEKAAIEYEKINMPLKAEEMRQKAKDAPPTTLTVDKLVAQLAQSGQTVNYYCCHCGEPLKVGAKNEPLKTCPSCKYDLSAIDLAKLINQHI